MVDPTHCLHRWTVAVATGAHLLWRVKDDLAALGPHRILTTLTDGSQLVELTESDGIRRTRRKNLGDPDAPRLAPVLARLIRYTVTITDDAGEATTATFTVLTDPHAAPAEAVAAAYERRWQVELATRRSRPRCAAAPDAYAPPARPWSSRRPGRCSPSTT